jgi:hypothetical protein
MGDNGAMLDLQHPACMVALIAHRHHGHKSSWAWRHWIISSVAKASTACQSISCTGASCGVPHIWKWKSETALCALKKFRELKVYNTRRCLGGLLPFLYEHGDELMKMSVNKSVKKSAKLNIKNTNLNGTLRPKGEQAAAH